MTNLAQLFLALLILAAVAYMKWKARPAMSVLYRGWYRSPRSQVLLDERTHTTVTVFTLDFGPARLLVPLVMLLSYWVIFTYFWGDRTLLKTQRINSPEVFLCGALFFGFLPVVGWRNLMRLYERIDVYPDRLMICRPFLAAQTYQLKNLIAFKSAQGTPKERPKNCVSLGVQLEFGEHRPVRINAVMSGYKALLLQLADTNAEMRNILPVSHASIKHLIERN